MFVVDQYIPKDEWLRRRFDAVVREIQKVGMRGMSIDDLCKEAAEIASWIGEEMGKEAIHNPFAQRVDQPKRIGV